MQLAVLLLISSLIGLPVIICAVTGHYREKSELCPLGRYHDPVTEHCDPCKPHCLRGPPPACVAYCGAINTTPSSKIRKKGVQKPNCTEEFYYDPGTGYCDPCKPYCQRISSEEPPDACRTFCRNSVAPNKESDVNERSRDLSTGGIAAITCGVAFVLCAVVAIVLFIRHRIRRARRHEINIGNAVQEQESLKPSVPVESPEHERAEMVVM